MKKIVVYQSETGFTAKYADWIAEELGCEAKELKKTDINSLKDYDAVIYGGWIMGGMISGYDKVKALNLRKVVVFAVGMTVPSDEVKKKISEQNSISEENLFYFEGGYDPKKLGFLKRMITNMVKKSVEKKAEKTEADYRTLETFKGADRTSKEAIAPLVQFVKETV